jgi:hypothetical protein
MVLSCTRNLRKERSLNSYLSLRVWIPRHLPWKQRNAFTQPDFNKRVLEEVVEVEEVGSAVEGEEGVKYKIS